MHDILKAAGSAPSVPMMMRHIPPGNLHLRAQKVYINHACDFTTTTN